MVWNVSTGEAMRKFRGHAARVNSVTMNEESTVALSSSVDGSVRIWDLRSRSKEPIQARLKLYYYYYFKILQCLNIFNFIFTPEFFVL